MAVRSLESCRAVSLGLLALAAAIGCSSSDFSASSGAAGSSDAGDAGDDGEAGRPSAGRGGGRSGAGGTSATAGSSNGGRDQAGDGSVEEAGAAGSSSEGGSGVGGASAGSAGLLVTGGGGSMGVAGGGVSAGSGGGGMCTPIAFYPDADEDAFGRTTAKVMACEAPAGKWALKGEDCNDDNKLVFPKQPIYRATGYVVAAGTSFDYDCNDQEDPDPTQVGLAPNCASFLFTNCVGNGFKSTERTGSGVNPVCGSTKIVTCTVDGLGCKGVETTVTQGARCR